MKPDRGAEVVSKLKKGEEVVFMGDAEDGYLYVQGPRQRAGYRSLCWTDE